MYYLYLYKKYLLFTLLFIGLIGFSQERKSTTKKWLDTVSIPGLRCNAYLNKAHEYYELRDFPVFKVYNDSTLLVAQYYNLKEVQVKALINLGIYYDIVDEYENSLSLYHKALTVCDSLPEKEKTKISILVNIGNVYNNIGSYQKAIKAMEEVLVLSELYNVSGISKVAAYNILSNAYSKLGEEEKAIDYLMKMKNLGEKLQNHEIVLTALDNIANAYYKQGKYDEVIKTETAAAQYSNAHQPGNKRAITMLNLGMAYVKKKNAQKAIQYLSEALEIATAQNDKEVQKVCHLHLGRAYELKGEYQKSLKEQEMYAHLSESSLKDIAAAGKLDVKYEAGQEKKIIENQLETAASSNRNKEKLIIGSGTAIVFLGGMLFFFIRKKRKVEKERLRFKQNFDILFDENKALKTKMKELAEKYRERNEEVQKTIKRGPQYKNSSLTQQDRKRYMNGILDHMEKEKPYLDFDISQSDLATKLKMSTHHLSEVLNFCFEQNFYNFINIYRVNEAQKLMRDIRYKDYKVLAIGYEAGFKSKTSFNRVFKNHTGLTPSQFRKENNFEDA
ncbi:AraC family transcriptional regulator [Galbibacter pacificus]|uniref:AraC family transcriptional regulator n=1 Tax=Galbibacter pacificus TaxID=2996052 RepID=A0ABT6FNQ6_9FLAO|nr:AraC family transcriptional regulator [Galbibacter pacificus]MDG3581367.1 AraC family transcriptional regulator [Galbibacter pacificus]MDG3584845.1 AraC family transcriptional regulator [Galbibacter pacificus]